MESDAPAAIKSSSSEQHDEHCSKKKKYYDAGETSKEQTHREHHSQQQSSNLVCLFCEKPSSPSNPLHEAMTKMIGERVKRCATKLLDHQLLAKVSSGDLISSEAKYHSKCWWPCTMQLENTNQEEMMQMENQWNIVMLVHLQSL